MRGDFVNFVKLVQFVSPSVPTHLGGLTGCRRTVLPVGRPGELSGAPRKFPKNPKKGRCVKTTHRPRFFLRACRLPLCRDQVIGAYRNATIPAPWPVALNGELLCASIGPTGTSCVDTTLPALSRNSIFIVTDFAASV